MPCHVVPQQQDRSSIKQWSLTGWRAIVRPGLFQRGSTVEMMVVIRVGFLLCFVNDSVCMFRRAIETVQFERCRFPAIDDIVPGAGRDDNRKAVAHRMLFSVQDHSSLALFEANKLIQLMNLFPDLFTGFEMHQDQL